MDGYVTIGTKIDTTDFDAEIEYIENQLKEIEHKILQADMGFEVGDTQKLEAQYSKLIKQVDKLKKKQIELGRTDLNNIQKGIDKIGNSVSRTITKVSRWALAVFGVRSAYLFVRQAVSTLSQYNEQMATDLEYIRFAIASSLQPLIENLIGLVYKLLTYVNYISKAWFGIDLFANASADAMKRGANSAEKMKKSLAGFDEMNVLNDNGTTGALGNVPSMDLSKPDNVPIPDWIKWIADNKEILIAALGGIALGLLEIKFGMDLLKKAGLVILFSSLLYVLQQLIRYFSILDGSITNNGTTFKDFGKIIAGIGTALLGIALMISSLPIALGGAITLLTSLLIAFWDKIKVGFQSLIDWISSKMNWIYEHFGIMGISIVGVFQGIIEGIMHLFDGLFTGIKQIFDGILLIFKGQFKNGFVNIAKGIANAIIGVLNALISGINAIVSPIRALVVSVGKVVGKSWTMDNIKIPKIPKLSVGGIVNMPGKGVPIGGALTGEVSKEGVIPLTDSAAMQELGATIGRYITVNNHITTTLNGRVIGREMQKSYAEGDFAFNR